MRKWHKISPCPRCGGKVNARTEIGYAILPRWDEYGRYWYPEEVSHRFVVFHCRNCKEKVAYTKWFGLVDMTIPEAIRIWNKACNSEGGAS